jgi:hypothetical protein
VSAYVIVEASVLDEETRDRYGAQVAPILREFGAEVLAFGPWQLLFGEPAFNNGMIRDLVGVPEFRLMKQSARLVNTSRGPIIQEAALLAALREGRIAGAAVDVFDVEPLPRDHSFRRLENVVATPHIGFVSRELYRTFYQDSVDNIAKWLNKSS